MRHDLDECIWCGEQCVDGREETGGTAYDACTLFPDGGGDFGCADSPHTDDEGTGSHMTRRGIILDMVEEAKAQGINSLVTTLQSRLD